MQKFTGMEYLLIDIANTFGLDRLNWNDRLLWANLHKHEFEDLIEDAEDKFLFTKAVNALRLTQKGVHTGHMMFLDATASGLQIMAALSGCKKTAAHVNLINTGNREDVYVHVANEMNQLLDPADQVTRTDIKKPAMTHYYNKQTQDSLNENQQEAFYSVLENSFSGAEDVKALINECWNPNTLVHAWTLPDKHRAVVKVTEVIDTRIEVDELDGLTVTYRFTANTPSTRSTSLAPNIVHSIDGYIAREMVRRANKQGFTCVHIHDAFGFHPNYGNQVRQNYIDILAEIAESNLLNDILMEITGQDLDLIKDSEDLAYDIQRTEYALS